MSDLLTPEEIAQMRAELADVTTLPPPGREIWSVFRIVATLEHLAAERDRLRQALRDVCAPETALLRDMTEEQRRNVNSIVLVGLCKSPGFIQEIARKALDMNRKEGVNQ